MEPVIRPMKYQDLAEVALIEQQTARSPWDQELFATCLEIYDAYVGVVATTIVGFGIIVQHSAIREAHILNLAVKTQWQRHGIGSKMLNHLLKLCNNDIDQIFLEVSVSNSKAMSLYLKFKFEPIGLRKGYYTTSVGKEDAVVMKFSKVKFDI